jgi:MerR family transcriptional regulator, light-induced transcriptional regulator
MPAETGYLRIGELSRRVGVSAELLRAWERRYGLLRPARSAGGFRLYSDADERRVRRMRELLDSGLSAAEAARAALGAPAEDAARQAEARDDTAGAALESAAARLTAALDQLDEAGAQATLDRVFALFTLDLVLREILLTYLHELGERWERGEASVGQEHFASNLIRGRLLALARGWGQGFGPRAVLACAPDELHDLPLICLGLALHARGWAITFLGPSTPVSSIAEAAAEVRPAVVVVSAARREVLTAAIGELAQLGLGRRLAIAGSGADLELAERAGALFLPGDPVTEAERLSRDLGTG